MSRPYLRLLPLEKEETPAEAAITPRDLAVIAAAICAALTAFWWVWKKLVK